MDTGYHRDLEQGRGDNMSSGGHHIEMCMTLELSLGAEVCLTVQVCNMAPCPLHSGSLTVSDESFCTNARESCSRHKPAQVSAGWIRHQSHLANVWQ